MNLAVIPPSGSSDSLGTLLGLAVLLVVAVITAAGVVIAARTRKPTTEMELRAAIDNNATRVGALEQNQRVMFGAFDGLYSALNRTPGIPKLVYYGDEQARVQAGVRLVYGEDEWPTQQPIERPIHS